MRLPSGLHSVEDPRRRPGAAIDEGTAMKADQMLATYPATINLDHNMLARVIESLASCAQACTACADACLSEEMVAELRKCIRTNLDCADSCAATERILSRHTAYDANVTRAQLEACIAVCRACGDECEQHAGMHEHCRICAGACRECEAACRDLLDAIR